MITLQGREKEDSEEQDSKSKKKLHQQENRDQREWSRSPFSYTVCKGDRIPISRPLEVADLGFSVGRFQVKFIFEFNRKKKKNITAWMALFAQGSHTTACTEMSGEGGDRDWFKTHWSLLT